MNLAKLRIKSHTPGSKGAYEEAKAMLLAITNGNNVSPGYAIRAGQALDAVVEKRGGESAESRRLYEIILEALRRVAPPGLVLSRAGGESLTDRAPLGFVGAEEFLQVIPGRTPYRAGPGMDLEIWSEDRSPHGALDEVFAMLKAFAGSEAVLCSAIELQRTAFTPMPGVPSWKVAEDFAGIAFGLLDAYAQPGMMLNRSRSDYTAVSRCLQEQTDPGVELSRPYLRWIPIDVRYRNEDEDWLRLLVLKGSAAAEEEFVRVIAARLASGLQRSEHFLPKGVKTDAIEALMSVSRRPWKEQYDTIQEALDAIATADLELSKAINSALAAGRVS